ncbi:hypothetical protein QBC35DRAFT_444706 [Podospora australis]|uniref:FAD-binding domain-containing protein n=1 Tax=Podospora australis TaxID=1536484 RepID=A0AAN7AD17_9PEZI|nr:hypothetical protein QBC35DRAFT_444706 [Podospora australis]
MRRDVHQHSLQPLKYQRHILSRPIIRVRRRPWLELIKTGIDMRYGKRLPTLSVVGDDSVTAVFEDGTAEVGTLMIGAEGAHSPRCQFLFHTAPREGALLTCPTVTSCAITKLDSKITAALAKLHPCLVSTVDPSGLLTWIGIHDSSPVSPTEWTYMILLSWNDPSDLTLNKLGENSPAILADLHSRVEHLASPFKEAIQGIPEGTKAWHGRLCYWPTKPWDNLGGRVTLAGDAAHPMTFRLYRGQGLGNAIADAAELQKHLQDMKAHTPAALAEVVRKYEEEMWVRGLEAVKVNLENTVAIHDWKKTRSSAILRSGVKRDAEIGVTRESQG